ncbi:helix-turn-helix domain-containing protein [Variovorax atrisoli]|uniref:helix-turn-helix domain-containing protein n=1 Tax=Variovorax atrisoli TaxID=3394203 RepID=UPI003397ECB3
MRYEEFKRRLGKAGLSLKEFAELVGVSSNTVSNYAARGTVPPHLAVEVTLMGELAELGADFRKALQELELKERKLRNAGNGISNGGKQKSLFDQR